MCKLNIAADLSLPVDVVTQTFAIRRVGKTYTASVLAEEMMKAKLPLVIIDPNPNGRTKPQLALLSCYSVTSSSFGTTLGSLRAKGWIDGLRITPVGIEALGEYEPLPTGDALLSYWMDRLSMCPRTLLAKLAEVYPVALSKGELAEATGYSPTSGSYGTALGELRTLELITKGSEIKASDVFFE